MKNSLFNPENWIWQPFGKVADFLILSCLWLLCSIPVLTAGAATAALYDCCARCIRDGEQQMFSRFFRTFRRELRQGCGNLLFWALILLGGWNLIRIFAETAQGSDGNVILAYAMAVLLALLTGVCAWVFAVQSRFTFSFVDLQRMSLKLAMAHLPRTALLAAVVLAAGWLMLRFLLPVMVIPGIAGLLAAHILEPVFQKYETGDAGENT